MNVRIPLLCVVAAFVAAACGTQPADEKLYPGTFPLNQVELLDGPFKHAQDLDVKVLLEYDTDRLLAPFLKEAGLEPKGEPFKNWEGLDGHVAGHYVSALAMAWASTGNTGCLERLEYCISELKRCQEANGNGYIGGVPSGAEIFRSVSEGDFGPLFKAWVPWYNVHKIFAGLRDAWQYGNQEEARGMFLSLCDWAVGVIEGLSDEQMERMSFQEFGGMNEVLADAYDMTGDERYLQQAKRFSHKFIHENMAAGTDNLDNLHANTQVPKAVGYARIAAASSDAHFHRAAKFFWDRVANHRSVVIGGNSRSEHFPAAEDYISYMEHPEGPESCNTKNMLKLTEFLFALEHRAEYADFYEKALYNHILSTQHPEHGGFVYFTSMRPSHYRVYSQPNSAMWCCVGTGMENHVKYGEFIYSHSCDAKELFVNLYIPSRLDWKEKGLTVTQRTDFPYGDVIRMEVSPRRAQDLVINLRCPGWVSEGSFSVKVNGEEVACDVKPSSYLSISRKWRKGDVIEIRTPMHAKVVELDNRPEYLAVTYGPVVLAARTSQEHLDGLVADDGRWAHIAHGELIPIEDTPIMVGTRNEIENRLNDMEPVDGKPLNFTVKGLFNKPEYDSLVLEPFFGIHDSRYAIYFLTSEDGLVR